jgi:hypothetical protein
MPKSGHGRGQWGGTKGRYDVRACPKPGVNKRYGPGAPQGGPPLVAPKKVWARGGGPAYP